MDPEWMYRKFLGYPHHMVPDDPRRSDVGTPQVPPQPWYQRLFGTPPLPFHEVQRLIPEPEPEMTTEPEPTPVMTTQPRSVNEEFQSGMKKTILIDTISKPLPRNKSYNTNTMLHNNMYFYV
ncbi:hypothetical protein FKM82_020260 [Ascaphus truei]